MIVMMMINEDDGDYEIVYDLCCDQICDVLSVVQEFSPLKKDFSPWKGNLYDFPPWKGKTLFSANELCKK